MNLTIYSDCFGNQEKGRWTPYQPRPPLPRRCLKDVATIRPQAAPSQPTAPIDIAGTEIDSNRPYTSKCDPVAVEPAITRSPNGSAETGWGRAVPRGD